MTSKLGKSNVARSVKTIKNALESDAQQPSQQALTNIHSQYYRFQTNLENNDRVTEEIKQYPLSQIIMLGFCGLLSFPDRIIKGSNEESWSKLRRLDLSHNHISSLPNSLSQFKNLREIWLSYNPIAIFPEIITKCTALEVIDIRGTEIKEIPTSIVDLSSLIVLDWQETPAESYIQKEYHVEVNDLEKLCIVYMNINRRNKAKNSLYIFFYGEHYLLDVDKEYTEPVLTEFVAEISQQFDNLEDFESFARRPVKFVPQKVDEIKLNSASAQEAKRLFYEMKRETDRKRLSADVEIKIRGKYFDRIERSEVITLLDSIYANVISLEDIQFLVEYASIVLPQEVSDATGESIWRNILDLQDDLKMKREASVNALANAINGIYPEQKPETVSFIYLLFSFQP